MEFDELEQGFVTGLNALMENCGRAAANSGWHGDRPDVSQYADIDRDNYERDLRNWQGMKIMLMVSELAEAVEELRKGKTANETYYPTRPTVIPERFTESTLWKPEGVPSELADTIIRIMDFCFTEGIDIGSMVMEKLAFNATRGHKHGGKAV